MVGLPDGEKNFEDNYNRLGTIPVCDRRTDIIAYRQSFYRATRMHSADYAVARCLSVCHTPVLCLNGYSYLQSFFSPSGSPTILVFPYQTGTGT